MGGILATLATHSPPVHFAPLWSWIVYQGSSCIAWRSSKYLRHTHPQYVSPTHMAHFCSLFGYSYLFSNIVTSFGLVPDSDCNISSKWSSGLTLDEITFLQTRKRWRSKRNFHVNWSGFRCFTIPMIGHCAALASLKSAVHVNIDWEGFAPQNSPSVCDLKICASCN